MLHVVGYSTVADFPTDSGGPAPDDISAAVIPDVNGVPSCMPVLFQAFAFIDVPTVLVFMLLLHSCCCLLLGSLLFLPSLMLLAVLLLPSILLLLTFLLMAFLQLLASLLLLAPLLIRASLF